jgi:hypothetical protein
MDGDRVLDGSLQQFIRAIGADGNATAGVAGIPPAIDCLT